jgi:sugar lactone lactonase YvrE
MTDILFDDRICALGEGAFWHPLRQQFFWFDILNSKLLTRTDDGPQEWQMTEMCSAAGWIDADTLLIASETALFRFDLRTGSRSDLCALEADNPVTRSNDGRADPWGGFWIGTMGKGAQPEAGSIYRYFGGELRRIVRDITIPNAICFAPDQRCAYYADTDAQKIWRQRLDATGWPEGAPQLFRDLTPEGIFPDGAVTDAAGNLWNAQWGSGRVACYDAGGTFVTALEVPAGQSSCPAFGGAELGDLYVTTAAVGDKGEGVGKTYRITGTGIEGRAEPQVRLG